MRKLLLALAILLVPSSAIAQCNGIFPTGTFCGNLSGVNAPGGPIALSISGIVGPGSTTVGDIVTWNNNLGTVVADSGILATTVVIGPASAVSGNLASFNGAGGKLLQDSGIASTTTGSGSVVLQTSPALLGAPTAPTAAPGTNTTQIATTAFVAAAIPSICNGAGAFLVGIGGSSQCSTTAGSTATLTGGPLTINATGGNAAIVASGGGVSITTAAATWTDALSVVQSGPTTSVAGPFSYNVISVTNQGSVTGAGIDGFGLNNSSVFGFRVNYAVSNTGATSSGQGAGAFATRVTTTQSLGDVIGLGAALYSNVAMTLTGGYVPLNAYGIIDTGGSLNAGSFFEGFEIDVGLTNLAAGVAGTAPRRIGLGIWNVGIGQGSVLDTAIAVTNWNAAQSGAGGAFKNFVVFSNFAGLTPFTTGATLFSFDATATIANVFDFNTNAITVTGNILSFPNIAIAGSGLITTTAHGIGSTSTDRLVLWNQNVAANGAQQWSPRIHWIGQGWKTNATAASQVTDWIAENQTIQGAAAPGTQLMFSVQVNAGGYAPQVYFLFGTTQNTSLSIASLIGKNAGITMVDGAANVWYLINNGGSSDLLTLVNSDANGNVTRLSATQAGAFSITGSLAISTALGVASGGTNCAAASITCFNNITGFSAAGTTGTTSTNLVFSGSPTLATPTFTTSITGPLIIGGSGTTGTQLTFQTTSGNGTTDAFVFQRGNNGSTVVATLNNTGIMFGTTAPVYAVNVSKNTGAIPSNPLGVGAQITGAIAQADGVANRIAIFSAGTAAFSAVNYFTSRGTLASPTATQSADALGSNFWSGYGTAYVSSVGFVASAAETFSVSAGGAQLDVYTTPLTTQTLAISTRFFPSGGVGIGETATDPGIGSLQLNAQMFMPNITTTSVAQTGTVCWTTGTGKFTVDTTVGCLTSLEEAKDIVSYLDPTEALRMVDGLRPFAFRYKPGWGDGGRYEQFGLGAHQVAGIDERMIGRDNEGTMHGVRYMELTAVLVGAIKELKADNDNLRADLAQLRKAVGR